MGIFGEHRPVEVPVLGVDGAGVSMEQCGDFEFIADSLQVHHAGALLLRLNVDLLGEIGRFRRENSTFGGDYYSLSSGGGRYSGS